MVSEQEWLTVNEAASWLGVPSEEAVREAIHAGALPALTIGSHVRLSQQALISVAARLSTASVTQLPVASAEGTGAQQTDGGIPREHPAGFQWLEPLAEAPPFTHGWPQTGGGTSDEDYHRAWKGVVSLHGQRLTVDIGETVRDNRGRLIVWLGPIVICEFVATPADEWASLIRLWGPDGKKKVLALGETPPPLYRGVRIEPYQEATGRTGRGIPKGQAVVIGRDDHESAVYHATGRWLSWQHLALEPAA